MDNLTTRTGVTRLSGTVQAYGENIKLPSVQGLDILIDGPVKKVVRTDHNGFFEVWGMPAGKYTLKYELPDGWKIDRHIVLPFKDRLLKGESSQNNDFVASIAAKKHTEVRIYLTIR